jgi:hypothetical protein
MSRERGFSLMIVFLLVMVMVGLAGTVALSTQTDLSQAGQGREHKTAFYAAEYALAEGQAWLAAQDRESVLTSGAAELCLGASGAQPGERPQTAPRGFHPRFVTSGGDEIRWSFCVHNDAADPAYLSHSGDRDDSRDPLHRLVIEGYGFYGNPPKSTAHLALTVGGSQPIWEER